MVRLGRQPADREQGEAQVAEPGEHTVQRRLVDEAADEHGVAGGVRVQREAVEPRRPVLVEPRLELDLVPPGLVRVGALSVVTIRTLGAPGVTGRHITW